MLGVTMMGRSARVFAATAIACAVALSIGAARAETIAAALDQAWARHPAAAGLDARTEQAQAGLDLARRSTPGPASVSVSALSDRLNRDRGAQKWEFEVGVPIWLPGQQSAREAQARAAIEGVAARRRALRLQLAAELRTRWWAIALARDARDQAARRATTASELEAVVERRYAAGDLSRMDANLARGERLAAQAQLAELQSDVLREEAGYRALTGAEPPQALHGEPVAADAAMPAHPLVEAAEAEARAAQASLAFSRATDREAPKVSIRLERDRGEVVEPFSNAVGLKLTIPLASEALARQRSSGALAELSGAQAELAQLRLRLPLEVERSRAALAALEERLALANRRSAFAADNLRLAQRAFELGESDLTTLLRVRASALDAEQQVSRLRLQREAGRSELNQALGVTP